MSSWFSGMGSAASRTAMIWRRWRHGPARLCGSSRSHPDSSLFCPEVIERKRAQSLEAAARLPRAGATPLSVIHRFDDSQPGAEGVEDARSDERRVGTGGEAG